MHVSSSSSDDRRRSTRRGGGRRGLQLDTGSGHMMIDDDDDDDGDDDDDTMDIPMGDNDLQQSNYYNNNLSQNTSQFPVAHRRHNNNNNNKNNNNKNNNINTNKSMNNDDNDNDNDNEDDEETEEEDSDVVMGGRPSILEGLALRISHEGRLAFDGTYEISQEGTFRVGGFEINSQGMRASPRTASSLDDQQGATPIASSSSSETSAVASILFSASSNVGSAGGGSSSNNSNNNHSSSNSSAGRDQATSGHLGTPLAQGGHGGAGAARQRSPGLSAGFAHLGHMRNDSVDSDHSSASSSSSKPRSRRSSASSSASSGSRILNRRYELADFEVDDTVAAAAAANSAASSKRADKKFMTLPYSHDQIAFLGISGRGQSSTVRRAVNLKTWDIVAVKSINVFEKSRRHQLVKELQALTAYSHIPQLIKLYGAFYKEGHVSLVLEYVNRGSLLDVVQSCGGTGLSEVLLQRVAHQSVLALAALHKEHLIHRDIKPSNILISHTGEVKLADFGVLAALDHTQDLAKTHVGTTMYMSPERILGSYGTKADVWGLGMSLVALALGHPPYDSKMGYFGIVERITEHPRPDFNGTRNSGGDSSHSNGTDNRSSSSVTHSLDPHQGGGVRRNGAQQPQYSPLMESFVDCCLHKNPDERWSARRLLRHPWLRNADQVWQAVSTAAAGRFTPTAQSSHPQQQQQRLQQQQMCQAFLNPVQRCGEQQQQDIMSVLDVLIQHEYLSGRSTYRRSLFEQSRFQRIAMQVGIPDWNVMTKVFEAKLVALIRMHQRRQQQQLQQQQQQQQQLQQQQQEQQQQSSN